MTNPATNPEQPSSSEHEVDPPSSGRLPENVAETLAGAPQQDDLDPVEFDSSFHEHVTRLGTRPIPTPPPSPRKEIGGCTLGRKLGKGGMGTVFLAVQEKLKREVAVKIIPAGRTDDREDVERFRREAKLAGSLHHPNIVQVFDVGEEDNLAYLVMEYIEGGTLHAHLANRPMDVLQAALMLEQIARGIHCAHQKGIVHRDLKPGNILLVNATDSHRPTVAVPSQEHDSAPMTRVLPLDEEPSPSQLAGPQPRFIPKITDFGLAKNITRGSVSGPITATGIALGTPSYMAPEQARGDAKNIGVASDIYALGAILYEMLTGRPPFTGENAQQIMEKLCLRKPQPPTKIRPSIPADLERICLKCLAKDPRWRYPTGEALADDLRKFIDRAASTDRASLSLKQWVRRSPWPAWMLVAGLFVVCVLSLYLVLHSWAAVTRERDHATADYLHASDRLRYQQIDAARHRFEDGYRLGEQGDVLRGLRQMGDAAAQLNHVLSELDQPPSAEAEPIRQWIETNLRAVQLNLKEWERQRLAFRFDVMAEPALGFSFSPKGTWMATLDRAGTFSLFDFDFDPGDADYLGRPVTLPLFLPAEREAEPRFAWNADQTRLVVSCGAKFREFDLKESKPLGEPRSVSERRVLDLVYDAKTALLFLVSEDQRLRRIDLASGAVKELDPFAVPRGSSSLALSADGGTLAVALEDGRLRLLDPHDLKPRGEDIVFPAPIRGVGKTPALDEILIGTTTGNSYRFSFTTRRVVPLPNQGVAIESLGSSAAGFVVLDGDGSGDESLRTTPARLGIVRVLDSDSFADRVTPLRGDRSVRSLAPHPTHPMLAIGFEDGSIGVYAVPPRLRAATSLSLAERPGPLIRVQFSRDGKTLMLLGGEGARLFSAGDRKPLTEVVKPPFEILSGALHPDKPGVAFGGPRGGLVYSSPPRADSFQMLRDAGDSRFTLVEFIPAEDAVLGYSPPPGGDAEGLDAPGKQREVGSYRWPLKMNKGAMRLEKLPVVHQLSFGSTARDLALACQDGRIRLVNLDNSNETGRSEFSLSSPATAVAYHEKRFRIAAGGDDGKLAVWDVQSKKPIWEHIGHRQMVTGVAFSPDGRLLVSVCADGTARLWDVESGLPVGPTRHHGAAIRSLAFDPQGGKFVTGGADGQAYFWPVGER